MYIYVYIIIERLPVTFSFGRVSQEVPDAGTALSRPHNLIDSIFSGAVLLRGTMFLKHFQKEHHQ